MTRIRLFPVRGLAAAIGWIGCAGLMLAAAPVGAADANAVFTEALRKRGWDDTAVEYLHWVESSPLSTPEFAKELPYQRALSVAARARQTRNRAERERMLNEAAADFEKFAAQEAESTAAIDARRQSANIYAEQALVLLAESRQLPDNATAQRSELAEKARELLAKASAAAAQVVKTTTAQIAALPKAGAIQADAAAKSRRDQLRDRQVEARFLVARLDFEQAATFERDSPSFKKALDTATKEFGELVEEYRDSLVGTSSRFYQGRCAQELGEYQQALGCYEDITRLPADNPEFRRWAARAHRHRTESLLALDKVDDAISQSEDWLAASKPAERQQPEWLEVAYRLADAYQAKIKEGKLGDSEAKRIQANARNLVREASQHPNEFRQQAQVALAALAPASTPGGKPKSFDEAFKAGKTAIELWNSSNAAAKLAEENNPEAVDELQKQARDNRAEARRMLEASLGLAAADTPIDELNTARYFLSVLYWEDKQLHEAAVLSEFLATHYPENPFAASAAKVALAAYEALSIEARGAKSAESGGEAALPSYESSKLAELAELVATRWPESPEAASAANVLIQAALRENRLEDAEALLERLPAESRGAAQLSLGAGLWTKYLRATAGSRENPSEEAIALREKAGAILGKGFAALREQGTSNYAAAVGALYLSQYLLANGDAEQAVSVLENEKVGPLSLVEGGAETVQNAEFILGTYTAALRAYLSTEQPDREKAQRMMEALEKFAESGGDAPKLTDVYLGLGGQLQRQLKELNASGQSDKAKRVADAFGDVLQRVSARPDADQWRVRGWIAQTNLQLGQELAGDEAKPYIDRATAAYDAMLKAAIADPKYAPEPGAILGVRMRLAECLAATGQHEEAVKQFGAILAEKPNMLDLQKGAAVALQQWGIQKRDVDALDRSIRGDLRQKNGKNLIWGWLQLASIANAAAAQAAKASPVTEETRQRANRFETLFFEARYNVAKSRFLAGKVAPDEAKRREQLEAAKTNIEQMAKLYPGLGGPNWKPLFDELLKQVNLELEKK
ncbi:MAG: hypothetical protein JNL18_01645 [Planctomycetaceae bacterium]|nr:hypothetical protein [Planctomycetaceae bacterium]